MKHSEILRKARLAIISRETHYICHAIRHVNAEGRETDELLSWIISLLRHDNNGNELRPPVYCLERWLTRATSIADPGNNPKKMRTTRLAWLDWMICYWEAKEREAREARGLRPAWVARCKLRDEGDKLRAEGDKFYAEGHKFFAEGRKFYAEGNKLRAEGRKLWAEGDKLYAEGNKLWAEGHKLYNKGHKLCTEGCKLYAEGNKLRDEGGKLRDEGGKLRDKGNKLCAEGNKLYAEGHELRDEGDKLYAEGDKLWKSAVKQAYGGIGMTWENGYNSCTLTNGERYGYDT